MSMMGGAPPGAGTQQSPAQSPTQAGLIGNLIAQQLAKIAANFAAAFPSGQIGAFTLNNGAATVTVASPQVQTASFVMWTPTNAAAGTLEGSTKKLYISARVAGTSFTVSCATGTASATATFSYLVQNG